MPRRQVRCTPLSISMDLVSQAHMTFHDPPRWIEREEDAFQRCFDWPKGLFLIQFGPHELIASNWSSKRNINAFTKTYSSIVSRDQQLKIPADQPRT